MEQQRLIPCSQAIVTELQLRTKFEHVTKLDSTKAPSLYTLSLARTLIFNPSTSEPTISSIFETLTHSLNPAPNPLSLIHHTLSLLSDLAVHRPHLSHIIFTAVNSFSQLCTDHNSTRTLTEALSVLISIAESDETLIPSINELSEGLFVSLVFRPCVCTRHWLLLNSERFFVRPSLLLTVLLGFTKDPYPYVRRVSLDGLVSLGMSVVVEDHDLVNGCYWRAVELLSDMEDCVRSAAVRAVSEWGRLHMASNQDKSKGDWSDALFVQLCSMVRDMSLAVRVEVFDALGKIGMVSEDILLQTLSKKVLAIMKDKKYPGQCFSKQRELPASSAAGAFIHGLEDEFYEVRRSASHSLRTLTILSSKFACEALNFLMDVLNDDSLAVRLQALETMHHMAVFDHLKVQESHMHMFLGTLVDTSGSIRSAARRTLQSMKLKNVAMFKSSVDGLLENLQIHPQDEADVFSVLFNIGRRHGNFAVSIINEVSDEIEPSEGKLVFDSARVAALLVLAISVPLSSEQRICSIPPTIFSYAVTQLGRISHALKDIMDQNTLLAYLSHCSRSTIISAADFAFKEKETFLPVMELRIPTNTDAVGTSPGMHLEDNQFEDHEVTKSVKLILAKIKDIWQLIQYGCTSDVRKILRSWKEELATYTPDSSASTLSLILHYLRVVKLLAKAWIYFTSPRKPRPYGMVELGLVLGKLDSTLGEMRYRFIGLSKEEELHILELILLSYTLRLSSSEGCFESAFVKELYSVISRVEFLHKEASINPSSFVIELQKLLCDIGPYTDGASYSPFSFQKLVEFFSLKQLVFCGKLKHIKAEVEVHDNDFQNPFSYISGLPVGISLEISLYNVSRENKLWLRITLYEELTEFIFLDLDQFEGSDKIRKFTYVAPFYRTPKASFITLRVCIGMECTSDDVNLYKGYGGPKHELTYLCKEKQVYLSMVAKK